MLTFCDALGKIGATAHIFVLIAGLIGPVVVTSHGVIYTTLSRVTEGREMRDDETS